MEPPSVKACATDFQQWLWYHYRLDKRARWVCGLHISSYMRSTDIREDFIDAVIAAAKWDEDDWFVGGEDSYTDSPFVIHREVLDGMVNAWYVEYYNKQSEFTRYTEWFGSPEPKSLTTRMRFLVLKRDGYCCQLCGATVRDGERLEVDHIVAKSRGGSNFEWNLWTLCRSCNHGKSNDVL